MDSDSDSEIELKKASSLKGHKVAPRDIEFKLIFKPHEQDKFGLLYTLKQGETLPYSTELDGDSYGGILVAFGQDLMPSMGSGWSRKERNGKWLFTGMDIMILFCSLFISLLAESAPETKLKSNRDSLDSLDGLTMFSGVGEGNIEESSTGLETVKRKTADPARKVLVPRKLKYSLFVLFFL